MGHGERETSGMSLYTSSHSKQEYENHDIPRKLQNPGPRVAFAHKV